MKLTVLGTGDSPGTPVVGCHCKTCENARKNGWERLRFSILIQNEGKNLLIDTSPDMRRQLLKANVDSVDAVIWTHAHYDHFAGFGDFYRVQSGVNVYSSGEVLEDVGRFMFFMKYRERQVESYKSFNLFGMEIELVDVTHPPLRRAHGLVIRYGGSKIVITGDTNSNIPKESLERMRNPDLLLIDAIAPEGYRLRKHMNAGEAKAMAKKLNARKTLFVHVGHFYPVTNSYPLARDFETFEFRGVSLEDFI
ncbi:MBL fold metallo-hydrolase [Geoglobus acetivorans]|uniref:MBL fold metallo-hydrolase n=1 Tax=Geoglobus acetivorans TaxID=565033 RepID=A0ABZ3H6P1_GEOAI|nr:MBL fold metallo-hydrolase [Geoglobus acetivorans]